MGAAGSPRAAGANHSPIYVPGMPMVSGVRYDGTAYFGGNLATQALLANTLLALPMIAVHPSRVFGAPIALDRIGIEVTTAGAAGKKARLGLYAMGIDGLPGALIVDAGEVAVDAIAAVEATIAASVPCGVPFFRAIVSDGTPTLRTENATGSRAGMNSGADATPRYGYSTTLVYAAGVTTLPAIFPASPSQSSLLSRIYVRAL